MVRRYLFALLGAPLLTLLMISGAAAETTHVVQAGETLSHIAVRNGVTVSSLVAANGLSDPNRIRIGQTLKIPSSSGSSSSSNATKPVASSGKYTVRPGDTLSQIAVSLGVRSRDLTTLNGIENADRIRVGQVLAVPGTTVTPAAGVPGTTLSTSRLGNYGSLPSTIVNDPARHNLIPAFEHWAKANGIPRDLLMAIAWHESGWRNGQVSHKGAVGIGQIMPDVSVWIASDLIGKPNLDPTIAEDNIRMSARYVRWLIGYMDSEDLAIAAYYQGPGSVRSRPLYESTERYVASVKAHRRLFLSD